MTILVTAITLGFNLTEPEPKPESKNYNDVVMSLERTGCHIPYPTDSNM